MIKAEIVTNDDIGPILRQIIDIRGLVMELKGTLETHVEGQTRAWNDFRDTKSYLIGKIDEAILLRTDISKAESLSTSTSRKLDEHIGSHKWWAVYLVSIFGVVAWLFQHRTEIVKFFFYD